MFLSALTFLYLFSTLTSAASSFSETCTVPDDKQHLVRSLEKQMVDYANLLYSPDPSILIALNLAKNQDISVRRLLLQQLQDTAAKEMTSGKVALYVLALQSSCENPANVTTPEKRINLVQVLEEKTKEEIDHYNVHHAPKTTYYQLALDVLALCVVDSSEAETAARILAEAAESNHFQIGGHFSVDTAAMASLALTCVYNEIMTTKNNKLVGIIQHTLSYITKKILDEQKCNGIIGNLYSTGLAMQALSVTSEFYNVGAWSCTNTLDKMLFEVYLGAFNTPGAASQILPSLVGKTYLDIQGLVCSPEKVPTIKVQYTIIKDQGEPKFTFSITVEVPKGSVLLAVLETAQSAKPNEFSFQTEQTTWGPMVVSIHGIQADTNEKTYWQFLSGKKPLDLGVGSYKPTDNEHIVAIYSKY
ncbi:cobalamin binding intrinsic factor isoform X2 [Sceloporus undulatus]|nr:cobalamin binding intrinsic factor isoform X2 [Sceloporus undulatus]